MEDDFVLTWRSVKACPLVRRWSTAHFKAYWLDLSLSTATAIESSLFSPFLFAILTPSVQSDRPFRTKSNRFKAATTESPDISLKFSETSKDIAMIKGDTARRYMASLGSLWTFSFLGLLDVPVWFQDELFVRMDEAKLPMYLLLELQISYI